MERDTYRERKKRKVDKENKDSKRKEIENEKERERMNERERMRDKERRKKEIEKERDRESTRQRKIERERVRERIRRANPTPPDENDQLLTKDSQPWQPRWERGQGGKKRPGVVLVLHGQKEILETRGQRRRGRSAQLPSELRDLEASAVGDTTVALNLDGSEPLAVREPHLQEW